MSLDISKLENVKRSDGKLTARCPACAELGADLSGNHLVIESSGKFGCVVNQGAAGTQHRRRIFQLAGEKPEPIAKTSRPKVVAVYQYHGESGDLLFEKIRFKPKSFQLRRPDPANPGKWIYDLDGTRRVLYGLPKLITAIVEGKTVFLPEGEKDADTLRNVGFTATSTVEGAGGHWRDEYSTTLENADVVLLIDEDKAGHGRAVAVAEALHGKIKRLRCVRLPGLEYVENHGPDVSDWLAAGHSVDELRKLVEAADDCDPTKLATDLQATRDAYLCGTEAEVGEPEPVLVGLDTIDRKKINWLWPGRFALGKLALLAGDPGGGKSHLTLDIAARVSTGAQWPDSSGAAPLGQVILLSAEDDAADTIRPRLEAAGADLSRVKLLQAVRRVDSETGVRRDTCFSFEHDLPILEIALKRLRECRLVVIDPISAYLGATDSHSNAEVRALFAPVSELAARYGVAVLSVTHLNKGQIGGKAIYRAMGSLAFVAQARTAFAVIRDGKDNSGQRRLFLPVKNNIAPDAGTGLAFNLKPWADDPAYCLIDWHPGTVTESADQALSPQTDNDTEREEIETWLQEELSDGPVPAVELSEASGAGWVQLVHCSQSERSGWCAHI